MIEWFVGYVRINQKEYPLWEDENGYFLKEDFKIKYLNIKSELDENEIVWVCNECDELYEENTTYCEICSSNSIRIVSKGDIDL